MPPKRRSLSRWARWGARPRCAPNCRSKSSLASLPSSRSKSSWRPCSSLRKASRTRSGASPSASQKAAKLSKTFVVRTPPKSTRSPLRVATGHRLRAVGQLDDALAEVLEERVVGRAAHRALEIPLHEDDRLPERERAVPAHVAHRASAALLVARDQLVATGEALLARDR